MDSSSRSSSPANSGTAPKASFEGSSLIRKFSSRLSIVILLCSCVSSLCMPLLLLQRDCRRQQQPKSQRLGRLNGLGIAKRHENREEFAPIDMLALFDWMTGCIIRGLEHLVHTRCPKQRRAVPLNRHADDASGESYGQRQAYLSNTSRGIAGRSRAADDGRARLVYQTDEQGRDTQGVRRGA